VDKIYRRLGGVALALIMIPAFIGLLACMPVPIGDPERSKIDDELTGAWLGVVDEGPTLLIYEQYDKRTWLMRNFDMYGDYEKPAIALSYEEVIAGVDSEDSEYETFALYKVWRTKLGKQWFETWEPWCDDDDCSGLPDGLHGEKELMFWYVWRIEKLDADRIRMYMVNPDYEGLEDIEGFDPDDEDRNLKKLRRAAEKVIKRNIDDPDLYDYYEDDESFVMFRMTVEDYDDL
jgi:hypothetical protein